MPKRPTRKRPALGASPRVGLTNQQRSRLERKVLTIAERLGREAGATQVREESCKSVGIMGRYEIENLGLADFEGKFASRLRRSLERLNVTDRFRGEVEQGAWRAWVYARNERVLEACPRARVYGDDSED